MLHWELRKTLNAIIVPAAAALCIGWFFVCKLFFVGNYDEINGAIYREYIAELSDLTFGEQSEFIENERATIAETLSSENEMRDKYFNGEISDDDYLSYLDRLESCKAKSETFAFVERKFTRICEDPHLKFTYDLELEGHLTTMTADFPLIIMLLIFGCFVFIPDIPTEPFILTCKNGRRKTLTTKLAAYFIACGVLIAAFNFAELAALLSKDLGDLTAPAASMEALGELARGISSLGLIARIFAFRLLGELTLCAVIFALAALCRNHIAYFCSAALVMLPAFFAGIIPKILRGASVYYTLSGKTILTDRTELAVIIGSAAWIAASVIAVKLKIRR